ncbi:histidine phosphatase family protein [Microbacterium sp. W1N]|uniref:SixA phosphatase family protein n=1 Tax=Microbacterium festucae TaxID=2977531 RepID=UPI0021BEAA92|nr:histidine phosphatase family protein [Microbacterium festucae]MCT9820674.1 histidine phosphatase family protein [Microbacterium festucae]
MTTLILIRHAKSDWGDARLDDHDRPLNDRGLRDAPVLAQRLAATGVRPGVLLSSTALRARTTAEFFGAALGLTPQLRDELYGAPARTLRAAAAAAGTQAGAEGVVVVAHDPGMTVLADDLSGGGIGHMTTCAVATFRWDTDDWEVAAATDPASWDFDSPR